MEIPKIDLRLTVIEAATRQTDAAILAMEQGLFDVALTLAGAAEDMVKIDGPHMYQWLRSAPGAQEKFTKKEWIGVLNLKRDWLKHGGVPEMAITRSATAYMVARSMSKLEEWTPRMDAFKVWLLANLDDL